MFDLGDSVKTPYGEGVVIDLRHNQVVVRPTTWAMANGQRATFYMNPKDHPHGPTIAHEKSVLIEIYDGPHYYEKPIFHTDETVSGVLAKPAIVPLKT